MYKIGTKNQFLQARKQQPCQIATTPEFIIHRSRFTIIKSSRELLLVFQSAIGSNTLLTNALRLCDCHCAHSHQTSPIFSFDDPEN